MEPQFGSRSRIVVSTKPNTETPTPPQEPVQEVTPQATPAQAPVGADTGGIERVVRGLLTEFFAGNQQSPLATSSVRTSDLDPAVSPDPDRQFSQSGVPMDQRIFEPEAVTTSNASIDDAVAEAMATPEPEPEIESPVVEDTVPEVSPTASTTFATITKDGTSTTVDATPPLNNGFDSLTLAEGTNIHLDGRGFVTLPHGIVPDANSIKKSDGTAFDPTGRHGLRAGNLSSVDYSEATKYNISRADYTSDEDWAKAVYAEFGERTATEYGTGFEDLTDAAKQAAYDMTWNAGIGSASWSSVQTMLTEASKSSDEDKTTDNLIGFTTNFRSGTEKVNGNVIANYPRGLLKRRAQTYNLVAKEGEEATTVTTTSVMTNGARTGTKYDIKTEEGTVIKSWTKPDLNERLGDLEID